MKKSQPPFGIANLYIMVNIPLIFLWKIGITTGLACHQRQGEISKASPGKAFVFFYVPVPRARQVEAALHRICGPLKARYYNGDGASEWFFFPAALIAFVVQIFFVLAWIFFFNLLVWIVLSV